MVWLTIESDRRSAQENSRRLAEGVTLSGVPKGRGLCADVTLEKLDHECRRCNAGQIVPPISQAKGQRGRPACWGA